MNVAVRPVAAVRKVIDQRLLRYQGIARNDNKLQTMFAQANPWLVRKKLMTAQA